MWLIIRTDADGTVWKTYAWIERHEMLSDLAAHLNTPGVTRLEIIVNGES